MAPRFFLNRALLRLNPALATTLKTNTYIVQEDLRCEYSRFREMLIDIFSEIYIEISTEKKLNENWHLRVHRKPPFVVIRFM